MFSEVPFFSMSRASNPRTAHFCASPAPPTSLAVAPWPCVQVCVNGKGSSNSLLPSTIFCDDTFPLPSGSWQQLSIDVFDRMYFLFTAKNLTTSFMVNTDLPGSDLSVTTVTYQGGVYGCSHCLCTRVCSVGSKSESFSD